MAKGREIVHDPTYWVHPSDQLFEIAHGLLEGVPNINVLPGIYPKRSDCLT